jgi:hypothetical protein
MKRSSLGILASLWSVCPSFSAQGPSAPAVPVELLQSAGLVPNASFEEGRDGPTAWKLEGGPGNWIDGGHTGRRCVSITGTGAASTSSCWRCEGPKLRPRTAYRFSAYIKTAPSTSGGCIITGPSSNNRDYQASDSWSQRSFVFVTPDNTDGVFLRCGQWEVKGTIFFDDVRLRPVTPLYSRTGSLTLGSGERIEKGRYIAEPDFGGEGSNEFRGLISHTATFNSHRWVLGPGDVVIYKHDASDIPQTSGKLTVDLGYYQNGSLYLDASKDGKRWTRVGQISKQEAKDFPVPDSLYPATGLWVRLRGSGGTAAPCNLQVYRYCYEAALQGSPADAMGRTSYLEVLKEDPRLRIVVNRILGPETGNPSVGGRIESVVPSEEVALRLTLNEKGRVRLDQKGRLKPNPGGPTDFEMPFNPACAGTYELLLAAADGEGRLCFAAQTSIVVPPLYASDYGYLVSSGPQGDLWWCEGTYKISRKRAAPQTRKDRVQITAARNEYEPFQVVLRPAVSLKDVHIAATDLKGASGRIGSGEIDIDRVEWVRVEHPTDAVSCAGDWPDPLPHCDAPFDVAAGRNQPIWITVHVPPDAKAGEYDGAIAITAAGREVWSVPVSLHVLGFALPKEAHVFATFGFEIEPIRRYHNLKTNEEVRQVYELYMKNFAAHRIGPYHPMAMDPIRVTFRNSLGWVGGTRVRNEKASGAQSLMIEDDSDRAAIDAHTAELIPIDPRARYILRWIARTARPSQDYLVTVQNYDENKRWMSGRNIDLAATGTGRWDSLERDLTGRFPAESRFVNIVLRPVMWSERGEQLGVAWFDDVSFRRLPDGPELAPDLGFEAPLSDLGVSVDFAAFDKSAAHYLDEMGFTRFSLPVMGMGSGTFHSRSRGEIGGYRQGTPEYNRLMRNYLGQIERHLAGRGWLRKAYVYWFDEPEAKDYDFVREGMEVLKRSAPGLTRMLTEQPEPALFGSVDLWCPLTASYSEKVCRERQAAGEHVMWYVCCGPREPYATLFIDHPAIDLRMWLWQTYKYNVEGILIWATDYWTSPCAYPEPSCQNPWQDPMSYVSGYDTPVGTKQFWGNGDGRFLYPPNRKGPEDRQTRFLTGPVNSIRWEMLREGIEDFEYLWQLRQAVRTLRKRGVSGPSLDQAERLTIVPDQICKTLTEFTWDPRPLHEHRLKVGLALEALLRKYNLEIAK